MQDHPITLIRTLAWSGGRCAALGVHAKPLFWLVHVESLSGACNLSISFKLCTCPL